MKGLCDKGKKNRKRVQLIALIICASLLTGNALYAQATETSGSSVEEIEEEMNKVDSEIDELQEGLNSAKENKTTLESNKSSLETYLDELNSQYQTVSSQLTQVEKDVAAKQAEIEAKEAEIEEKEAAIADAQDQILILEGLIADKKIEIEQTEEDLAEQYESMKLRIQYMYENSSAVQYLELLLSSDSLISFLNRAEYIQEMMDYDDRMMQKYMDTKDDLDAQKEELESAEAELEETERELEEENEALQQQNEDLLEQKAELDELQSSLEKQRSTVSSQQSSSVSQLQEYVDQLVASDTEITTYEQELAAKKAYYTELLDQKEAARIAEENRKAQQAAEDTSGNITVGDSGISGNTVISLTDDEMTLLAAIIYCEARGEPYEGQLAVGYVVLNRVRSSLFPNTLAGVIYENKQFSPVDDGSLATVLAAEADGVNMISQSCWNAAYEVVGGTSNVGECLFFRTWKPVPQLEENLKAAGVPYYIIGNHIFYYRWVNY